MPQAFRFSKHQRLLLIGVFVGTFFGQLTFLVMPWHLEAYRFAVKAGNPWWGFFVNTWNTYLSTSPVSREIAEALAKIVPALGFALNCVLVVLLVSLLAKFAQRSASEA